MGFMMDEVAGERRAWVGALDSRPGWGGGGMDDPRAEFFPGAGAGQEAFFGGAATVVGSSSIAGPGQADSKRTCQPRK